MKDKLREVIQSNVFVHGLGSAGHACTVGAINLAVTGKVREDCPDCMCPVLHAFVIPLQDAMPEDLLNSQRWRDIAYRLAGSKADEATEVARMHMLTGWMWGTALPQLKPIADKNGFGPQWQRMLKERSEDAARKAALAAWALAAAARAAAAYAADVARKVVEVVEVVEVAEVAAVAAAVAAAARAAEAWEAEAWEAARAAAAAQVGAGVALAARKADSDSEAAYWQTTGPFGLMERLLNVREGGES